MLILTPTNYVLGENLKKELELYIATKVRNGGIYMLSHHNTEAEGDHSKLLNPHD